MHFFIFLLVHLLFITEEVSLCKSDAMATLGLCTLRLRKYGTTAPPHCFTFPLDIRVNIFLLYVCHLTGVSDEQSEETAPRMGRESEG